MFKLFVLLAIGFVCNAFPRYQRLRREAESASSGPCKNTYDQCPEWKGQGMCVSDQYKDYMETVCPVTCDFCKVNHARDQIEVPEDSEEESFYEVRENDESPEEQAGDEEEADQQQESGQSESGASEESDNSAESGASESDSEQSESGTHEEAESESGNTEDESDAESATGPKSEDEDTPAAAKDTVAESEGESGQAEESKEDEETIEEEDAKAVQPPKQAKLKQSALGSITLLLRQNFQSDYTKADSASYKMLAGNVASDFKKALKTKVTDISFSEGTVDGNPPQKGKTKITFNFKGGNDKKIMKALTKLVDDKQNINGLSVYSGSLEFDE